MGTIRFPTVAPFGVELGILGLFLDVSADEKPDGIRVLTFQMDPSWTPTVRAMRHSVYAFPEARAHLASWIRGRIHHESYKARKS